MQLSFVILSCNSIRYIDACIRSIVAALPDGDEENEIWVVENGSSDGSVAALRALENELRGVLNVIYLDHNTGTTVSRNAALRRATGRHVVIMDSDVTVNAGIFEPMIERLQKDHSCGIVAPLLTYPDGRFQISTDVFPTVAHKVQRALSLKSMENAQEMKAWPVQASPVDYAISAFWMLRRDVIERVGLLDERIFYSPEDVDYCLRVWAAGYRVIYDPGARAVHDAQEISRGLPLRAVSWSHAKGLLYLFWKHRYAFGHARLYRRIRRNRSCLN